MRRLSRPSEDEDSIRYDTIISGLYLPRPPVSGKYYYTPRGTTGTTSFAANFVRYTPYYAPFSFTADRLIIYTTSTATGLADLGIYEAAGSSYGPGDQLLAAGTVATSAASGERAVTISYLFKRHTLYWLSALFNVATTAAHTSRAAYTEPTWGDDAALTGPACFAYESRTYASGLPATATPTLSNATQPTEWIRAA